MREDGEGTPLLRDRAAVGDVHGGGAAVQQPAQHEGQQDGATSRNASRQQPAFLSGARSRPLLLAVAAVGAAVLVIAVGLMSISGQAGSPQGGVTSLAAATPRENTGSSGDARGHAAEEVFGAGGRDQEGSEAGIGEGVGSSTATGGGWRSQPDRVAGNCDARRVFSIVTRSSDDARIAMCRDVAWPCRRDYTPTLHTGLMSTVSLLRTALRRDGDADAVVC